MRNATLAMAASTAVLLSNAGIAAEYPAAKEADWIARDFKFHTGEVLPEVVLHYRTVGASFPSHDMRRDAGLGAGAAVPLKQKLSDRPLAGEAKQPMKITRIVSTLSQLCGGRCCGDSGSFHGISSTPSPPSADSR